jgi:hypothetical protein
MSREEKSHSGPNLLGELTDWAADERQRENWKDDDRSAYHYRRMVLEGAIREIETLTKERDEILATHLEVRAERDALFVDRDQWKRAYARAATNADETIVKYGALVKEAEHQRNVEIGRTTAVRAKYAEAKFLLEATQATLQCENTKSGRHE